MKMRSGRRRLASAIGLLLVAGTVIGCTEANSDQPETFPVEGKITYLSNPLTKGTVTFQPVAGRPATGAIGADGSYQLGTFGSADGAIPGTYRVVVLVDDIDHHALPKPGTRLPKDLIPARYRKAETSGLEAKVETKANVFNFDLK
jgi:hypothetical protein